MKIKVPQEIYDELMKNIKEATLEAEIKLSAYRSKNQ
jgi:hypothetical protein